MPLQQQVEKLLLDNTRPDVRPTYSEATRDGRLSIRSVAKGITDDQAIIFTTIHQEAMKIVDHNAAGARATKNTAYFSQWAINLLDIGFDYVSNYRRWKALGP